MLKVDVEPSVKLSTCLTEADARSLQKMASLVSMSESDFIRYILRRFICSRKNVGLGHSLSHAEV